MRPASPFAARIVLIIDDDELGAVAALAHLLGDEGFSVLTACNGQDAIEQLRLAHVDLILLDYSMPLMDGAQTGHALRSEPRTSGIPIIMTTSMPECTVRERFSTYDHFMAKPIRFTELLKHIRRLI